MSQYNRGIYTKMDIRTILGASEKKKFQGPTPYILIFLVSGGKVVLKNLPGDFNDQPALEN